MGETGGPAACSSSLMSGVRDRPSESVKLFSRRIYGAWFNAICMDIVGRMVVERQVATKVVTGFFRRYINRKLYLEATNYTKCSAGAAFVICTVVCRHNKCFKIARSVNNNDETRPPTGQALVILANRQCSLLEQGL